MNSPPSPKIPPETPPAGKVGFPTLSVSLGFWPDRPAGEVLDTARAADTLGFAELWTGEMATYDAFALATAVGMATDRIPLTVGPLPVTVRDPAMIAIGTASVAALTSRRTSIAIGTSSPTVVERWHGRTRGGARALAESATAVRDLLTGRKTFLTGEVVSTNGYRLRLPPVFEPDETSATRPGEAGTAAASTTVPAATGATLTVAAFGPAAIRVAAAHADRMVINLVGPATAGHLRAGLDAAAAELDRRPPRLAVWVPTAVEPNAATLRQLRSGMVGYLAAPGYAAMFRQEGFGSVVTVAESGAHPRDVLAAVPDELVTAVSLLGTPERVAERLAEYAGAGVDEVVLVPSSTPADPAGVRTLTRLAPLIGGQGSLSS